MAANPEAAAPVELQPCDTCGRKFNPTALERHAKVKHRLCRLQRQRQRQRQRQKQRQRAGETRQAQALSILL